MINKYFKYLNPTSKELHWKLWVVLLIELLGTFLMVFEIIIPSAIGMGTNPNLGEGFNTFYNIVFGNYLTKAIWVTGFILILIYALRKISVNLNPAVTLSEAISGHHTWGKAFSMIGIQFIGAFAAAFLALGCAHWSGAWADTKSTLDGVEPRFLVGDLSNGKWSLGLWFGIDKQNLIDGFSLAQQTGFSIVNIIIEAIFTFTLVATIIYFPKAGKVTGAWRPWVIVIPLTIMVALGIHTNNIAFNPARLIAPAVVSTAAGGANTMQWIWVFLLGELIALGFVALIEYWRKTGMVKLPENIFGASSIIADDSSKEIVKAKNSKTTVKKITKK